MAKHWCALAAMLLGCSSDPTSNSTAPDPIVSCPEAPPEVGAPCTSAGRFCPYTSKCGATDRAHCTKVGDTTTWILEEGECLRGCPTKKPVVGTPCNEFIKCPYPLDCTPPEYGEAVAYCMGAGEKWSIPDDKCHRPAADCPKGIVPKEGAACSADAICHYNNGCGDLIEATCSTGTFKLKVLDCKPECPKEPAPYMTKCEPTSTVCRYIGEGGWGLDFSICQRCQPDGTWSFEMCPL